MRIRFSDDYDHKWPSGAETAFKAGMELPVKREVGEAAIGAGKGKEVRAPKAASSSGGAKKPAAKKRTGSGRGPGRPPKVATPPPPAPDPVPVPPAPPAEPAADEVRAPGAGEPAAPLPAGDNS